MIGKLLSATRYALLSFRRNPAATFFTIVFPLIFLVIFVAVFGNEKVDSGARVATFIVPGILGLSIVSATFVNQAMTQVFRREAGQLKRLRGTPLPAALYITSQILASLVIVAFMTVLVSLIGRLRFGDWLNFGVVFQWETIGVFLPTIVIGSIAFSAMGLALTAIIPNEDAAPAITNAVVFPLYFISDVFFFSDGDSDGFLSKVGSIFPIKPLVNSLQQSYDPFLQSVEIPWAKWAVILAWGAFAVVIALRFFRWTAQTERR